MVRSNRAKSQANMIFELQSYIIITRPKPEASLQYTEFLITCQQDHNQSIQYHPFLGIVLLFNSLKKVPLPSGAKIMTTHTFIYNHLLRTIH